MKHCLIALLCLGCVSYAGFNKQQAPNSAQVSATKRAYDEQGNVDLEPLVDLVVGDTIAFKIKDKIVVGTVKQRTTEPKKSLKLFGEFSDHNKSGFVFEFTSSSKDEVTVKGIIFFVDLNKIYTLEHDKEKNILVFKEQNIAARSVDS